MTNSADYCPFGGQIEALSYQKPSSVNNDYGYQGLYAELDENTGWHGFELRQYDAFLGRWTSMDPYGQYASPYLGMGNSPVNGVDPDGGLNWWVFGGAWAGGLIGGLSADNNIEDRFNDALVGMVSGAIFGGLVEGLGSGFAESDITQQNGGHWWFNDQGEVLFNHWRTGNGAELHLDDPEFWGSYMRAHKGLSNAIESAIVENHQLGISINGRLRFNFGGGFRTGYQLLGGSNADVGGSQYSGSITQNGNEINYRFKMTWNDIMDPNFNHLEDRLGAKLFPGTPYRVRISWIYDFTYYRFDE